MPGPKVRPPKVEYNSISGQQYNMSGPDYLEWEQDFSSFPEWAKRSVTILKLPRELIHAICEILLELPWGDEAHEPAHALHAGSALHKGRTHLRNFALISRVIHPVVQRLLYRDITFFNHKRSAHLRLLRTVDSSPTLVSFINSVDFAWFPSIAHKSQWSHQIQLPPKPKQTKPNKDPTHLQTWFYKNLSQSIFCDRDKSDSSSSDTRCSIYEDHGLCMMLLTQLPNLRSARIRLPNLAYSWRKSFQNRNLRWPPQNPRLTNLTELQLVPQSAYSFPLYTSIGVLNGTRNLTTLVLIDARDPIVSPSALKLPHLLVLVIKDGGLFLKPHLIKHLTKSFTKLSHFQIDFFDHLRNFNLGTNYVDEIWTPGRYFTEFEINWDDTSLPTNPNLSSSSRITVPSLNRYCNVATNLLHSLELVSGTLESLYIGQLSIHLRSCRDKRGRCRIKPNPAIERLCSLKTFPKLKRVCIDVRMIDKIDNTTQPEVLVDLLKDCKELESFLFYGLYHVNMRDQFEVFAKSVGKGELCPRLRKVALLADDFGKNGRQVRFIEVLGGLAMVWNNWDKGDGNKGVELVLLRDGDADVEVESEG
ncbi:hypothetical protein QBC37DRAFT_405657 [Rhypophila decipiens]|uniref:Uncharacterized protein n=1 Tax=Rhypophila decipiens TaxID=261697 RepID=A0AAN6XWT9_9PEZI|nr:hypothetical protein QBC37DRAFT_405657 [Rhypophila decipiens]